MLRRRMKSERGAAVVEFALVVPILLGLVFGIAEFGNAFFVQATMAGAAREGARALALGDPTAVPRAKTAMSGIGSSSSPPPTFTTVACPSTNPPPPAQPPNATFTITWNMPSITGLFGSSFNLTGTGVMRCNG
jgi:Flp pilus assembly protein TadG